MGVASGLSVAEMKRANEKARAPADSLRGEKGALIIPADVLARVSWNPFFPYLASRVDHWIATAATH